MTLPNFPSWNRVVALAGKLSRLHACKPNSVFGEHGLYLSIPPSSACHDGSPLNITEFAWTGGDGVEFSFLGGLSESAPVVMNVPSNSTTRYLIVGDNLLDFLSLGCLSGFFGLEQLTYRSVNHAKHWRACHNPEPFPSSPMTQKKTRRGGKFWLPSVLNWI